jgi:murein DD-endopeptidase MepM/ murein hydrolase activator NlpD
MQATRFVHPMKFDGRYDDSSWAGYKFKEALGYTSGKHTGVDYNYGAGDADKGFPCLAIAEGIVRYVANMTAAGFGNTVIVEHLLHPKLQEELGTPALYSRYMHLLDTSVSLDQEVRAGQHVGRVGDTGTEWAHLHIDLWKANLGVHVRYDKDTELASYLDPYRFIEEHQNEIIEEEEMITEHGLLVLYRLRLGRVPGASARSAYLGKKTLEEVDAEIAKSPEFKQIVADAKAGKIDLLRFAPSAVRDNYNPPAAPAVAGAVELKPGIYEVK